MDFFDRLCGYIEDFIDTGKLGWCMSLCAEAIFLLFNLYYAADSIIKHHYFSVLLLGYCIYLSSATIQNLYETKSYMLTNAFKQGMRADPMYGLSKVIVVFVVSILALFSSDYISSLIMFFDQVLYLAGFYIMIANPIPPYKKSYAL